MDRTDSFAKDATTTLGKLDHKTDPELGQGVLEMGSRSTVSFVPPRPSKLGHSARCRGVPSLPDGTFSGPIGFRGLFGIRPLDKCPNSLVLFCGMRGSLGGLMR
jgi:hypothetical protein